MVFAHDNASCAAAGIDCMYDNVVFSIAFCAVFSDCDVIAVFHVDRVFTVMAAAISCDYALGAVPNAYSIFPRRGKKISFNAKTNHAFHEVHAPALRACRMRMELIIPDHDAPARRDIRGSGAPDPAPP